MRFFGLTPKFHSPSQLTQGETTVLDYLRIVVNARLAKMEERGASAVEYGLLVAGIAAVVVAAVLLLGPALKGAFSETCEELKSAGNSTASC